MIVDLDSSDLNVSEIKVKTIIEIIEVKKHTVLVKLCLWIAIREIQLTGTSDLYIRQFTDCTLQ